MTITSMYTVLEHYFQQFRKNIIGIDQKFISLSPNKKSHTLIGLRVVVCTAALRKNSQRVWSLSSQKTYLN